MVQHQNNAIRRITTSEVLSFFSGKRPKVKVPPGITAVPDGALWFTNARNNSIRRITAVPEVTLSPSSAGPGAAVSVTGEGYQPGRGGGGHAEDRADESNVGLPVLDHGRC